ncbi:hypothetical protein [Sediminicola arcticus]|jgi:hypothetical protein|uniref:Lipocalin-like domain-containing protein n=1 Tax=Sediminicola arcticus TaxID=1574308 RepID=A0ABV2SXD7_9FLAO
MKLFISTVSLLIFFWSINVESPIVKKDRIYPPTNTVLENNVNNDFNGLWINEDNQTRGTSKCKISYKNKSFVIQMWASCHPQDCDWGEKVSNEVKKGTNKFELLWDHEFAESIITYEIIEGKLKLTQNRRYKDNSGREDFTIIEYFIKK